MDKQYITHKREPFFQIAKKTIRKNDAVLDIGPGNGEFASFCNNDDMFMLEGNPVNAERLSAKYPNVVHGKLPKLPFKDSFFDVIHMSHVIEHLQPQEVYDTLVEMTRCCKKGGRLVISAPLNWDGFYDDLSHVRPYPPLILKKYLCDVNESNFSRPKISSSFLIEHLEYRYRVNSNNKYVNAGTTTLNRIFIGLKAYFDDRFFQTYSKTGYTIVLKETSN